MTKNQIFGGKKKRWPSSQKAKKNRKKNTQRSGIVHTSLSFFRAEKSERIYSIQLFIKRMNQKPEIFMCGSLIYFGCCYCFHVSKQLIFSVAKNTSSEARGHIKN